MYRKEAILVRTQIDHLISAQGDLQGNPGSLSNICYNKNNDQLMGTASMYSPKGSLVDFGPDKQTLDAIKSN